MLRSGFHHGESSQPENREIKLTEGTQGIPFITVTKVEPTVFDKPISTAYEGI